MFWVIVLFLGVLLIICLTVSANNTKLAVKKLSSDESLKGQKHLNK
jgi:hypothetical protein